MEQHNAVKSERYRLIDALRGTALLNMIAFHFCYDFFVIYGNDVKWASRPAAVVWERMICCAFILLSGVSLNFSRHAYRRGLIVSACGLAVTLVTLVAMPDELILFGVLTCIGLCMLITQALRGLLEKCNPFAGAAASFLLFGFFYGLPRGFLGFFDSCRGCFCLYAAFSCGARLCCCAENAFLCAAYRGLTCSDGTRFGFIWRTSLC